MVSFPIPGHEKIVSVTMAPVNRNGISSPMFVITGNRALRSACLKLTTRAGSPFALDRKSTRLNSSHANISYAVFCLKKKKKQKNIILLKKKKKQNNKKKY